MLPEDDARNFDSLDDFIGDRSLLDDAPREAPPKDALGEARESRGFTTEEPDDTFDSFDRFLSKEKTTRFPRLTSAQRKIGVAMLLTTIIAGAAFGASTFMQILNPPTVGGVATLTRNCEPVNPTPSNIVAGTAGFVIWECTTSQGAFTVNVAGAATPTVSSGTPWTTLNVFFKTAPPTGATCSSSTNSKVITSGSAVSFASADMGDWNYCADYVNAISPMPIITYQWSQ